MISLARVSVTAALVSLTTGCVTLGKAGVLGFDYEARDRLLGRDGPGTAVAVGGHVDLNVYARRPPALRPGEDADGLRGATKVDVRAGLELVDVRRAMTSIPEVARLDEPAGPRVRVHGVSPGFADITVESDLGGDTVTLGVAEVDTASVEHWIAELLPRERFSAEAAFVQGGTGRFALSMRDASGRAVVGAGIVPPVAVEPAGAASVAPIADGDLRHAELRFDRAGPVELRMRRRDPMRLLVVEASAVRAIEIVAIDLKKGEIGAPSVLREGGAAGVGVRGTLEDGRRVMLLGDVARVASSTPDVCATPAEVTERVRLVLGDGAVVVDAIAPGACGLVATLGSLRAETSMAVEPKPEEPAAGAPGPGGGGRSDQK